VHANPARQQIEQFDAREMLQIRSNELADLRQQSRELAGTLGADPQSQLGRLRTKIDELIQDIEDMTGIKPGQPRPSNAAARLLGLGAESEAGRAAATLSTLRGQGQASTSSGFGYH
jgi:hypothetical protein